MKANNIKLYAQALAEILFEKAQEKQYSEKEIVNNFVRILARSGYEKRTKEILDLAEGMLLHKKGIRKVVFETARKIAPGNKKLFWAFLKENDNVKEKINPRLIAGIKIIINDSKQFDASLQSKLSRLFAGSRVAGQN